MQSIIFWLMWTFWMVIVTGINWRNRSFWGKRRSRRWRLCGKSSLNWSRSSSSTRIKRQLPRLRARFSPCRPRRRRLEVSWKGVSVDQALRIKIQGVAPVFRIRSANSSLRSESGIVCASSEWVSQLQQTSKVQVTTYNKWMMLYYQIPSSHLLS